MKTNKIRGFTLIEFMVASALAIIVIMAAGTTYLTTRRLNQSAQQRIDVQNDLRNAAVAISRDARVAGTFGCMVTGGMDIGSIPSSAASAAAGTAYIVPVSGEFPDVSETKMKANPTIYMDSTKNDGYGVIWTSDTTGLSDPKIASGITLKGNALVFIYGKGNEPVKGVTTTAGSTGLELATTSGELQAAMDNNASLILSTCSNAFVINATSPVSGGKVNFTSSKTLTSDFNTGNLGHISVSQFYAVAYIIGEVNGVDSLLRYEIGDDGNWQEPELLAKNVSAMDVSFAYEKKCDSTSQVPSDTMEFEYVATPSITNLPALVQITLTYAGSAQTQYVINAAVRGGNSCVNTVSYPKD
ncbi:MAG: prepilin-type N-terminal cleavage/methylation domain-containing protein [Neisseriaceae bacterium]|nr:prepilin-type N-terminal cleavage/methylation domain-containing protein [Neisseriaceae bacterium]